MAVPYFFSMISPEAVAMGSLFLIFFAFLNYVLSKVFRNKYGEVNKATTGIISFSMAVLIIYFGRETIYNLINGLRLSNTILYILSIILVLVLLYIFRRKLKFCTILMLVGAGLILIGALTNWFYQKWFVIILGVGLLLLGIWLCTKKPKGPGPGPNKRSLLIREAKAFKKRALRSRNPKFNGGWTHFVSYLKRKRYGSNEATITQYFGVSQREFVSIFNRYGIVK